MADWIENVIEKLEFVDPIWIHLFLMVSSFIETVFPPWPGDVFIVFSGVLMYYEVIKPLTGYISTLTGNIIGTILMYFLGNKIVAFAHQIHQKIKINFIKNLLESILDEKQKRRSERWIQKWGFWFVLISRFFAGVRYFVSIIAGITRMNFGLFFLSFSMGVILWNSVLFSGGFLLAENWKKFLEWLNVYNTLVGILLIILSFIFMLYIHRKKKEKEHHGIPRV